MEFDFSHINHPKHRYKFSLFFFFFLICIDRYEFGPMKLRSVAQLTLINLMVHN